ncbi:MAG: fibrillarin-like rRNA/tRNA 2'-O-methyltransferase [Thermoplasmata archaeon]|nr:MAG: fibrillarin-like rRNA/tRNA 2'-O-methyltransferase [Thermoplasmata archaeon]
MRNVLIEGKKVYTIIPDRFDDASIYGERVVRKGKTRLREWNPYRSKLSALILLGASPDIKEESTILYLGASTGTTVSHLSDICHEGRIYAVEVSPFSMRKLISLAERRDNIFPIMEDANHPERYMSIVPKVDLIYQDISQRNQVEIFLKNCELFMKKEGMIMVKARSIDVSAKPEEIFDKVKKEIEEEGYRIKMIKRLDPYARDHACMIVDRG